MKLVLAETKLIKDSIAIISELVSEAQFKITKNSIELVAMDPANVSMVIYRLLSSAFVEFEVKEDVTLSINLNDLKQVLRRAKSNDTMTLEAVSGKFKITLKSATTRTFNIPLIDIEEKEQKVPDLSFNADVKGKSSMLSDSVEDMDIIGESVTFSADDKKLVISSSSDLSDASVEIACSDNTEIKAKEKVKSKYSIEYLKKMIQGGKLAEDFNLHFSNDYPMKLEYLVMDKLQLFFILAPRVDND